MRAAALLLAFALGVPAAATPAAAAEAPAAPRGNLLLNGGGGEAGGYWERFFALAGGKDAAIVVIPTASERPEAGTEYVDEIAALGATHARSIEIRKRDDASTPDFVEAIRGARGIFFTGGDQSRITAAFLGSPAEPALREAWSRGAVIGGSSAGLACMSAVMITGNGDFTKLTAGNVETVRGLGFVTEAIVDQHFVARQRENRLISVVLENPELLGIGVDERTSIWISPERQLEVFGEGWAVVFDARKSAVRRQYKGDGTRLAADEMTMRVLVSGDRMDLATGELLPAKR